MTLNIFKAYDENEKIWTFSPQGEIDIYTSPKFEEEILSNLKKKRADLLIDGKELDYIDSTGLGSLMTILKEVKDNGNNIYIENIKENIRKLLEITSLEGFFDTRGEKIE